MARPDSPVNKWCIERCMAYRVAFGLLRVVLPAWVGAAVLFAINGSAEQAHSYQIDVGIERVIKDQLALLRFPAYYAFGFTCVGLSIALSVVSLLGPSNPRKRIAVALALLLVVLSLMLWDYHFVYGPMFDMLDPTGVEKSAAWKRLHAMSMITNLIHVSLCLAAAIVLSWPRAHRSAAIDSQILLPGA